MVRAESGQLAAGRFSYSLIPIPYFPLNATHPAG